MQFVASQPDGHVNLTIPIPNVLQGAVGYKVIIKSFHVIVVGDLAAQMTFLQGCEGMASCHCIKCDLTKEKHGDQVIR